MRERGQERNDRGAVRGIRSGGTREEYVTRRFASDEESAPSRNSNEFEFLDGQVGTGLGFLRAETEAEAVKTMIRAWLWWKFTDSVESRLGHVQVWSQI